MKQKNPLAQLPLFAGTQGAVLDTLYSAGNVKQFASGGQILRARVPAETVCILLSGKAFTYSLTHTGHRKITFIFGPGALLNDSTSGKTASGSFCEAMGPCLVFCVPADALLRCMKKDFGLAEAVLRAQERKLWRLEHQQKNSVHGLSLERKLAAKLWKLGRDFGVPVPGGTEIDLDLPVAFLADMLGAARETTSRLRGSLLRRGLLAMDGKRIMIPDPERLSRFYRSAGTPEDAGPVL